MNENDTPQLLLLATRTRHRYGYPRVRAVVHARLIRNLRASPPRYLKETRHSVFKAKKLTGYYADKDRGLVQHNASQATSYWTGGTCGGRV